MALPLQVCFVLEISFLFLFDVFKLHFISWLSKRWFMDRRFHGSPSSWWFFSQFFVRSLLQRWFLTPPHVKPEFHPDMTSMAWYLHVLPTLAPPLPTSPSPSPSPIASFPTLFDCTLREGEILFIPGIFWVYLARFWWLIWLLVDNWYHATLNIGETVFVSVFVWRSFNQHSFIYRVFAVETQPSVLSDTFTIIHPRCPADMAHFNESASFLLGYILPFGRTP
jgi:hypothetical protein